MCARYTQHHSPAQITERFGPVRLLFELPPRYNIAPGQTITVIRNIEHSRVLQSMKWGLIPFWAKDSRMTQPLINARAESLAEKPAFRHALQTQRCLIPADGFYEWIPGAGHRRQPVYFRLRTRGLFAFAGLWERRQDSQGEILETCALITVPPNSLVAPVHNRMPAILSTDHESSWLDLDCQSPAILTNLLKPYPAHLMESFHVSPRMNSPRVDDPNCVGSISPDNPGQDQLLPGLPG